MGMKNPLLLGSMALLERLAYAMADHVIALAPGIREGVARTGFPRERITLIPNGCDLDLFAAATPLRPADQFPGMIAPGDFVAVFTGAHGKANGLAAVVAAGKVLEQRGRTDIKLLLIGGGAEKAELMRDADGLQTVRFADAVPKQLIASLIRGGDAGLQILANVPAFYDGTSPNKFFDYLAGGLPVIINYPGWLAELVREQGCGWAVSPDDPEAFADALIDAADDREEALRRGAAALALGSRMFAREALASRFVETLEGSGPDGGRRGRSL
jgi:glycosyltransferase involved in cell wall biosynthesis